ncbi:MAG: adenylate/guanylate cyclase domain-containing protein, partial [Planctomycetaceae bacterium]
IESWKIQFMPEIDQSSIQIRITGPDPNQKLLRVIKAGTMIRIGRAPKEGWSIPWDKAISREHADLRWSDHKLHIEMTLVAQNPLIYRNRTTKNLIIAAGDSFQIGDTTFQTTDFPPRPSDIVIDDSREFSFDEEPIAVAKEHSFSVDDLRRVAFRNSDQQMEILSRLPRVIANSKSDMELVGLLSRLLLEAISVADAVAIAHFDLASLPTDESDIEEFPKPLTMQVETRDIFTGRFIPSRRLLYKALQHQESAAHVWDREDSSGQFTISEGLGWAFCTPILGEANAGWCMYVSGKGGREQLIVSEEDLASDLRFSELVGQFIGSIRHVRLLHKQKTQLSSFFSPKVIQGLTEKNNYDPLQPSEKNISVLFCDVRGFSRKSEQLQNDLMTLLQSVKAALGIMAGGILDADGAIADFQGDAALGFWGWPSEGGDGPVPACRAALAIYESFYREIAVEGSLLEGFAVGLGVAHGRALAGQIGTEQQAKIGVFGPVVNQGARLETMTKQFAVPICVDEVTATFAKKHLQPSEGRIRQLARVRPKGMDTPMTIYALLPPADQMTEVTDQVIEEYEKALQAVVTGRWNSALDLLSRIPDDDGPKQFLLRHMDEFNNTPPADWDGAFSLSNK